MLIDTGWNDAECKNKMLSELKALDVDLGKTDLFVTHMHADHLGLAGDLATDTSTVYFNRPEASNVNQERSGKQKRQQKLDDAYILYGYPEKELKQSLEGHPGRIHALSRHLDFRFVKEGDTIEIGDYHFRTMETPGHSPGHSCLYEPNKRILVAGDHILSDISPNIAFSLIMADPLQQYLESLEKISRLEISLVLPGHRRIITDHKRRITELREHHQVRLTEVISALQDGDKTAYEVAPYVTWNTGFRSWKLFPSAPKRFAFGETLAHLEYLENKGTVRQRKKDNTVKFSLA